MRDIAIAPITLVLIALLCSGCAPQAEGNDPIDPSVEPVQVSIAQVERVDHLPTIRRTAHVRSRVDVWLSAEAAGVIEQRPHPLGARVRVGAVLIQLKNGVQMAAVKAALAQLESLSNERADLSARRKAEAALTLAQEQLGQCRVHSHANGAIVAYGAQVGEYVLPGTPLVRIVDQTQLYAQLLLRQDDVLGLRDGMPVEVTLTDGDGTTIPGQVAFIASAASDPASGAFPVEVDLPKEAPLRPGFRVEVAIPLQHHESALVIPRDAIYRLHGTTRVYVAREQGAVHEIEERRVVTAERPGRPDLAEVISGLKAGESVVVGSRLGVADGIQVHVRK